jgi:hypothetical protein
LVNADVKRVFGLWDRDRWEELLVSMRDVEGAGSGWRGLERYDWEYGCFEWFVHISYISCPTVQLHPSPLSWVRLGLLPAGSPIVDVGGGIGSTYMQLAEAFGHLKYVMQDRASIVDKVCFLSFLFYVTENGLTDFL